MLSCSHDHIVVGFTTTGTCAIRALPTTVVSSNPVHEVYSIQHYVIKFVSDLWQISGLLQVLWFPPPMKLTAMNDIIEIFLKVALNTIILTLNSLRQSCKCILSWWKSRQLLVSYFTNMNSTKQLLCLSLNSKIQEANRNLWKSCSWFETGTQCGWA